MRKIFVQNENNYTQTDSGKSIKEVLEEFQNNDEQFNPEEVIIFVFDLFK